MPIMKTMLSDKNWDGGSQLLLKVFGFLALSLSACYAAGLDLRLPPGSSPCNADATLARAGRAYREASSITGVASYDIRVPGAPAHNETQDFGFGPGTEFYLRLPQGYTVVIRSGHLFGFAGERTDTYVTRSVGIGLQASIDAAFEGIGPPLVPVPVLLAAAETPDERSQAFALKFLIGQAPASCAVTTGTDGKPVRHVALPASNGSVEARFDDGSGLLTDLVLEVIPAPGEPSIKGTARYAMIPGGRVPGLPETAPGARVVPRFRAMDELELAPESTLSGETLLDLDGSPVRLDRQSGSLTVLEFWASWCAPCRLTLPLVEEFARWVRRSNLPVKVYLVNTLEGFQSVSEARKRLAPYLAQAHATLPTLVDLDESLHRRLGSGLPLTVLIDDTGRIVGTYSGLEPEVGRRLKAQVRALIAVSTKPQGPPTAPPVGNSEKTPQPR